MAQSARSDFDSLCLKYRIIKQYDWLGSITEWKVLEGALEELHVSKLDQADFNVLWSTHPLRKQGKTNIIRSHASFFTLFLSFPVYFHLVFIHVVILAR
jgi:hypothetical protein